MCGGGVLNLDGIALYSYITRGNVEISYDDYLPVEFCGALGALFFSVSLYQCTFVQANIIISPVVCFCIN